MANITNIKLRNDSTVHSIALPFATCGAPATSGNEKVYTLTFPNGDTITNLVNGQQLMVRFSNGSQIGSTFSVKITDGASITYTVPVVLNSLNTSIAPDIGAGAVVNLTYYDNNFYISSAAALTGFEVPTDVTLATVTNSGKITTVDNNSIITTVNNNSIITTMNNRSNITTHNSGSFTIINESSAQGSTSRDAGWLAITNEDASVAEEPGRIYSLTNKGLIGRPDGSAIASEGITNESTGWIRHITNFGTIDLFTTSSTITTLKNIDSKQGRGQISYLENGDSAYIQELLNGGQFRKLTNNGTIGATPDPNYEYGIENSGKLYNIINKATIYNISNNNGKTIQTITNAGIVQTITNTGTIQELDNQGTLTVINRSSNLQLVFPNGNFTLSGYLHNTDVSVSTIVQTGSTHASFWEVDPFVTFKQTDMEYGHSINWPTLSFVAKVSNLAGTSGTQTVKLPVIRRTTVPSATLVATEYTSTMPDSATIAEFNLSTALPVTPTAESPTQISSAICLITNPSHQKAEANQSRKITFYADNIPFATYTLNTENGYSKYVCAIQAVGYFDNPYDAYKQRRLYLAPVAFTTIAEQN